MLTPNSYEGRPVARVIRMARWLPRLAAVAALGATLGACILTSEKNLVTESEATTPLPPTFQYAAYRPKDDGYGLDLPTPPETVPTFHLVGKDYVASSTQTPMAVRFAPLSDGSYLIALTTPENTQYGVATYIDNVLDVRLVIPLGEQVNDQLSTVPGLDVPGDYEAAEIGVATRPALDQTIALYKAGKIEMQSQIGYIVTGGATPPEMLIRDGGGWVAR
jgi:hypothetical protein